MKNKFILPLLLCILLVGCGGKADSWQDETEFGDINIDASVVNVDDVEEEYDIDKYLNIVELNTTPLDKLDIDNFSISYNLIAEQVGLDYIKTYEIKPTIENHIMKYKQLEDYYGIQLDANEETGIIYHAFSQVLIENGYDTEEYHQAMGRAMATIIGAVPNLKKYDISKIYFEISDSMRESGNSYSTSYNGITINISRSYNWMSIDINIPR